VAGTLVLVSRNETLSIRDLPDTHVMYIPPRTWWTFDPRLHPPCFADDSDFAAREAGPDVFLDDPPSPYRLGRLAL